MFKNVLDSLKKQKKQVEKALEAYNAENTDLFGSTGHGKLNDTINVAAKY